MVTAQPPSRNTVERAIYALPLPSSWRPPLGLLSEGVPATSIVRVAADGWSANDLRTVITNVALPPRPPGYPRYWFIDEVSAVTGDWAQQVKWLRDNDSEFADATVCLTGSDAAALTAASGVLAGRRGRTAHPDRSILPIGFRSFSRLLNPALPELPPLTLSALRTADAYASLLPWLDDLVRTWELYVPYGGFPVSVVAARAGTATPREFVTDLFNVVFHDAFANSSLSVTTTTAMLARLWAAMAAPANLSNIGADVGVSQEVMTRHVGYLRNAYLLWHCPQKAERTWAPRLRAQDKLYAIDPLIARLAHLRNDAFPDVDPTVLTEMQVGMGLHRAAYAAGTRGPTTSSCSMYAHPPVRRSTSSASLSPARQLRASTPKEGTGKGKPPRSTPPIGTGFSSHGTCWTVQVPTLGPCPPACSPTSRTLEAVVERSGSPAPEPGP